jgi:hypothetical protein
MALKIGTRVWVPCEVKPGPFSDERFVKICVNGENPWLGFVPVDRLKEPDSRRPYSASCLGRLGHGR